MKVKTRPLAAAVVLSLMIGGGIGALAADWLPWGGSKGETNPTPAPTPAAVATQASAEAPASTSAAALPSFAGIASRAEPAVVNISTTQTVKNQGIPGFGQGPFGSNDPFEEFFRRFMPQMPRSYKARSLGSGFVIDPSGIIATNNHVVEHADEILVKLSSGEHKYKAKVLGTDPKTDLAVIKIEPEGGSLPSLSLGDSDALRVGDWVVAIGNPFGLEQTVTAGIVSAKGRVIGQGPYDDFIQTDASINPGNSGGPLLNLQGEVIGINSSIFSETGGNMGIGFAIPSNLAKSIVEQLRTKGKVVRGWLGVMIQDVTEDLAKSFNLSEAHGALVSGVKEGGPGDKGGIQRGDIIVEFDGQKVSSSHELPALVAATPIGKKVDVQVLREGKEKTLHVTIGEMPKGAGEAPGEEEEGAPSGEKLGLMVAPVTPDVARSLGIEPGAGVLVRGVKSGSPAEEAGLRAGDVIIEVNRKPVKSVQDFTERVDQVKSGESLLFLVRRGDATIFFALKRP